MRQHKNKFLFAMIILSAVILLAQTALANSAEPPGLTIVASFAPDDLDLSLKFPNGSIIEPIKLDKETKAWEAYFRFYYWMEPSRTPLTGATIIVRSAQKGFECPILEELPQYNQIITLDYKNESIAYGQPPMRNISLVAMRVIFTLLIEGLIFYAFKYRGRFSWALFIIINLITQGFLNISISGINFGSYWILAYIFLELCIFVVEPIAFSFALKEQKKGRAVSFALTANLASLIIGGLLISFLPI